MSSRDEHECDRNSRWKEQNDGIRSHVANKRDDSLDDQTMASTVIDETATVVSAEARAIEEVLNAFLYYATFGKEKISTMIQQLRKIPQDHQILVGGRFKEHINDVRDRIERNQEVFKLITTYGIGMFGDDFTKAVRIHQDRRPTSDFTSKVLSTMRQICREWSSEGAPERDSTFSPIISELNRIYPEESNARHQIRILIPGCGLGRLAHELIEQGYSVQGNEFSFFMLLTSCFILNSCKKANAYTIYPYLFDKSNSWKYEDQLRGVPFPDRVPSQENSVRQNSFSMCAGDFLEIIKGSKFESIVTAWFLDTAHNVIEYIDAIYECLKVGGSWINVGPLTWHYEDVRNEISIELPYSEIMNVVKRKGFEILHEKQIGSNYTVNRHSMLQNQFTCAFFSARKLDK